ncbi:hypothetical protein DPMN_062904 [Dreissena polymorpha]|uniref:Uncharacterized protein n=2 Tax=Dreissena polymorpha TaxID=45954 RepID=A0A9D4CAP6_DREPO|nr:hypothetical protein DPMN_062904 [Dreissena polymorpha]
MEEGKTAYIVNQPTKEEAISKTKTRPVVVIAIVLVSLVIASVVIFVAVYFGIHMTKNSYQEAWKTLRDREGRMLEEKVTKTKDCVEIDVPNSLQSVYDYRRGIVVERYTDLNTKLRTPCYVRYINTTTDPGPNITMDDTDEIVDNPEERSTQQWLFTQRVVPWDLVSSPRVQELCRGTSIFWMDAVKQSTVQKRQTFFSSLCYTSATCLFLKRHLVWQQLQILLYNVRHPQLVRQFHAGRNKFLVSVIPFVIEFQCFFGN